MNRLGRSSAIVLAALSSVLVVACATEAPDGEAAVQKQGQPVGGPQRYIVKFKNPAAKGAVQAAGGSVVLDLPAHDAFAATIPAAAVAGLSNNPNIEFIEEDAIRTPSAQTTPWGIPAVQAPDAWTTTTGTPVSGPDSLELCIIDSGLDKLHPDFAALRAAGRITFEPGADTDTCGHGTHVAGTIAAANDAEGVVGVAPSVRLHIVKVFDGADCGWSYASGLVAALDACKAAGAKIVSMSLGGPTKSVFEDSAFARAYNEGVLSIAAAGNDGVGAKVKPSYPASYNSVMSVAAVREVSAGNYEVATFSQQNSQVEIAAPGVHVLSTQPLGMGREAALSVTPAGGTATSYGAEGMGGSPTGSASGVLVNCGIGDAVCAAAGKICLIQRGSITFEAKVKNCADGGGLGAIIYNNADGIFGGDAGASGMIPSISISKADGEYLRDNRIGATAAMSLSATDYAYYDGTSMATPHVAGVAALVWAAKPSLTNAQVREALDKTAKDLGPTGRDIAYGFGLVQARAALDYTPAPPPPPPACGAAGASCSSSNPCCPTLSCDKRTKKCK